jgi:hypothetical protein
MREYKNILKGGLLKGEYFIFTSPAQGHSKNFIKKFLRNLRIRSILSKIT